VGVGKETVTEEDLRAKLECTKTKWEKNALHMAIDAGNIGFYTKYYFQWSKKKM
jgi:hypothetical protein